MVQYMGNPVETGRERGADALKKPNRRRKMGLYNFKGLLIFLVVFGHLLEPLSGGTVNFLYLLIYSFHMPAFIFLSGWFSGRTTLRRTLTGVLLPYLVFQPAYLLCAGLPVQLYAPYWIMWYLFTLFLWRLLAPVLQKRAFLPWVLFPVSVLASLLCGYVPWIGYTFALSRALVFLPYFLAGYALGRRKNLVRPRLKTRPQRTYSLAAALCCTALLFLLRNYLQRSWTFGASSYAYSGSSPGIRLLLLAMALLWIWFFLAWIPEGKVFFLTTLGRNTMFVYLLHGFFKLWLDAHAPAVYRYGAPGNLLLAFLLSLGLCVLFGNYWLGGVWRWLMEAWRYFLREIGRR